MVTHSEFVAANRRMKELMASTPSVREASYDRRNKKIILHLSNGIGVFFSPSDAQGLEHGTAQQLSTIEISPSGLGIHFPLLDADFYLPALLEGVFGSPKWMASRIGKLGGLSTSKAKTASSRMNGTKGGRPRKTATSR